MLCNAGKSRAVERKMKTLNKIGGSILSGCALIVMFFVWIGLMIFLGLSVLFGKKK